MRPEEPGYWANLLRHTSFSVASNAQRTPTYASHCWLPRASSGSQLGPVPGCGGPAKIRWPEGVTALNSIHGEEWAGGDVYPASSRVRRLLHDLHPALAPVRVHALCSETASPERRPDRPRLRARDVADRLLHLLGDDLPALGHPPRSRRSRGAAPAARRPDGHAGDGGPRAHARDGGAGSAQKHGALRPAEP